MNSKWIMMRKIALFPKLIKTTPLVLFLTMLLCATPIHSQALYDHTIWLPVAMKSNTNPIHQGIATYYYATGDGACMFGASPDDLMVAAMNAEEYDNARCAVHMCM
jgi:hypothetical protein